MARPGVIITDREQFATLWLDPDVPLKQIMAHFGVKSYASLYYAAKRFGLPPASEIDRPVNGGRKLNVRDAREARARYERGEGVSLIAEDFKVSKRAILNMARRDGWARPGSRKTKVAVADGKDIKPPRLPKEKALERCFALRRLNAAQITAIAKSGGAYAELEKLANRWGKGRAFLLTCWHEYKAVV